MTGRKKQTGFSGWISPGYKYAPLLEEKLLVEIKVTKFARLYSNGQVVNSDKKDVSRIDRRKISLRSCYFRIASNVAQPSNKTGHIEPRVAGQSAIECNVIQFSWKYCFSSGFRNYARLFDQLKLQNVALHSYEDFLIAIRYLSSFHENKTKG